MFRGLQAPGMGRTLTILHLEQGLSFSIFLPSILLHPMPSQCRYSAPPDKPIFAACSISTLVRISLPCEIYESTAAFHRSWFS